MIYNIYPKKDSTIYNYSASMNTGMDQLLEIEKILPNPSSPSPTIHKARPMLQFDWATAYNELINLPGNFSASFAASTFSSSLKLHTAEAVNIPYTYKIEALSLDSSWEMGIGKRDHTPVTEKGVSWDYRDTSGSTAWSTPGGTFAAGTNIQTQSFEFETTDININISESLAVWHANKSLNHGILLRITSSQEADSLEYGALKFFSRDSNTIYSPKLQIGWDDSSYSTGSLSAASSDEIMVYLKNNKYEYNEKEVVRIQVRARDIYTTQTYATTSAALDSYYLPTGSYYSIKDAETEESVIDFDNSFTKVSCDSNGNYFDLAMNALTSERLYKIVLKVEDRNYSSQIEYFDSNHVFKVIR